MKKKHYGQLKKKITPPTKNILRERLWILQSRQLIRKLLRTCIKCPRITSQPYAPLMGNLPEGCLSLSDTEPPWTHVGVDLTGAIQLRRVGRRYKRAIL